MQATGGTERATLAARGTATAASKTSATGAYNAYDFATYLSSSWPNTTEVFQVLSQGNQHFATGNEIMAGVSTAPYDSGLTPTQMTAAGDGAEGTGTACALNLDYPGAYSWFFTAWLDYWWAGSALDEAKFHYNAAGVRYMQAYFMCKRETTAGLIDTVDVAALAVETHSGETSAYADEVWGMYAGYTGNYAEDIENFLGQGDSEYDSAYTHYTAALTAYNNGLAALDDADEAAGEEDWEAAGGFCSEAETYFNDALAELELAETDLDDADGAYAVAEYTIVTTQP